MTKWQLTSNQDLNNSLCSYKLFAVEVTALSKECVLSGNIFVLRIKYLIITAWVQSRSDIRERVTRGHCGSSADCQGDYDSNRENDERKNWPLTNDNSLISQQLASQLR